MGNKPLPAVPPRILALKTPPFPPAYPNPLVANNKLQKALEKALAAGPGMSWRVGVAIVSLEKEGAQPMAHFKGDREFFGASLIKVAALYALYELRTTLRGIATELGTNTSKSELLMDFERYMNPKVIANLPTLPALKGIPNEEATSQFPKGFKPVDRGGGKFSVDFSDAFAPEKAGPTHDPVGHIEKMIVVSDNLSAARCIHVCGYGYLNGALAAAGIFEPAPAKGLWLAGDYPHDKKVLAKYNYYRIDSDNDGLVAQASTPLHLARMLTLLHDGVLFGKDKGTRDEMLKVMAKAATYPEVYITRASSINFSVTHNKLGIAELKPDDHGIRRSVESECSIINHTSSGRKFVVVWLNYLFEAEPSGFDTIGTVVSDTITEYLKP